MAYEFDGKYGPIPNNDGYVSLFNYSKKYIKHRTGITELPDENKEYLNEVFTNPKYKVVNTSYLFLNCFCLESVDVSDWDMSNVIEMDYMFAYCTSLKTLDVSKWDMHNVEDMEKSFYKCSSLENLDVSKWDTHKIEILTDTFNGCKSIKTLDISNWYTPFLEYMTQTFMDCESLTFLDFNNIRTDRVFDISKCFYNCNNLKIIGTIDLEGIDSYYSFEELFSNETDASECNIILSAGLGKEDFFKIAKIDESFKINIYKPNDNCVYKIKIF